MLAVCGAYSSMQMPGGWAHLFPYLTRSRLLHTHLLGHIYYVGNTPLPRKHRGSLTQQASYIQQETKGRPPGDRPTGPATVCCPDMEISVNVCGFLTSGIIQVCWKKDRDLLDIPKRSSSKLIIELTNSPLLWCVTVSCNIWTGHFFYLVLHSEEKLCDDR